MTTWSIRNAALPARPGRWSVQVTGGLITRVEPDAAAVRAADLSAACWDAAGRLVSPGFVDAHVHLDKALSAGRVRHGGAAANLDEAIRAVRAVKESFTADDVARRAAQSLRMGLRHGTTTVRSHCEADRFVGQRAVEGLRRAAAELAGEVDLQVVAFPQEGWFETPGTLEDGAGRFVEEALAAGVRVVGGNVNRGLWPSDPQRQVDETFALAARYDCDVDYHLDNWDGPQAFTLPYVARKTIERGWQGRVSVAHIASLAHVPDAQAAETIGLVREAGISVCVLPTRMRLTRVRQLMDAGVNVVCATDNLRDPFVRYGDADPLKALLLLAQLTQQLSDARLEALWPLITGNAARMLRLPGRDLAPGSVADLVVLDAPGVPEAILLQAPRVAVIKDGAQVAGPVSVAPALRAHTTSFSSSPETQPEKEPT